MKKIRFLYLNEYDLTATVKTASSEASGFPLTNLVNRWHTRCWRSTGVADEWITMDLGAGTHAIYAFAIKNHNFTDAAVIKIQGNATDAWGSPSVDVTMTYNADVMREFWSSAQNYQWWRLHMVDAANPASYLKFGRPYIGGYFSPIVNFTRHYTKKVVDPSTKMYSPGGQVSVDEKTIYKIWRYNFDIIEDPDQDTFADIFNWVGQSKGYFICQDADDTKNILAYVENVSDWEFQHILMDEYFSLGIDIQELR